MPKESLHGVAYAPGELYFPGYAMIAEGLAAGNH